MRRGASARLTASLRLTLAKVVDTLADEGGKGDVHGECLAELGRRMRREMAAGFPTPAPLRPHLWCERVCGCKAQIEHGRLEEVLRGPPDAVVRRRGLVVCCRHGGVLILGQGIEGLLARCNVALARIQQRS